MVEHKIKIELSRYSNSYFSLDTGRISPIKISMDKQSVIHAMFFRKHCFVFCVGILIVRKCEATAIIFHTFSIFQFIILHNYRLDFLPQGFKLKFFLFCGLVDSKVTDFVDRVRILIVEECQIAPNNDQYLCSNSCVSITTDLTYSTKFEVEEFLLFEEYGFLQSLNPVLTMEAW